MIRYKNVKRRSGFKKYNMITDLQEVRQEITKNNFYCFNYKQIDDVLFIRWVYELEEYFICLEYGVKK